MDIKRFIGINEGQTGVSGLYAIYGSFGIVDGTELDAQKIIETQTGYVAEYDDFTVESVVENHENGVVFRQDRLIAKSNIVLNKFASRFLLEGGNYDVYTQSSCWMTESAGRWQPLVTGVEISNVGLRTTDGATPMVAIRNNGNGKILVFHLMPNAMWKIRVSLVPIQAQCQGVLIEAGINDSGLNMHIEQGEKIEMPRMILYEARSELDLDAWKLHTVYNRLYPRKTLPVMYNTWMLHFDTIDVENIFKQVDCAADLGVEQFLVDAGWFGTSDDWTKDIGQWSENLTGGFHGRFKELSDYVRSKKMKFGLWMEPERARISAEAYKQHPQYYIREGQNAFLNFADPSARNYITEITLNLIETYHAECLKFDLNAPLAFDPSGNGFYHYFKGVRRFLADIKEKYPDIYITNCSSGGNRMELENGIYYDSVWSSDNQSPIYGLRIFKDTALRMPPSHIEKWDVRRFFKGFPQYGNKALVTLPISCNGGTWDNVLNVKSAYTHGFMTGGPIGFSTDIAAYPEEEKEALKNHIKQFKKDRDFYKNATMRILHNADNLTVIEYADDTLERVVIQIFTNILNQSTVTVYPVLDIHKNYLLDGKVMCGSEIAENGIKTAISDINCVTIDMYHKSFC